MQINGRPQMKHSFVNWKQGYQEIHAPENQMLVLLLMSWFIADQFVFYRNDIVRSGKTKFSDLRFTVVSDKLSGDDGESRKKSETNLRNLIDPDAENVPLFLTRSPASDVFSGDLIADNLAGWLNTAMQGPTSKSAQIARSLISLGTWNGWHQLVTHTSKLELAPAAHRIALVPGSSP